MSHCVGRQQALLRFVVVTVYFHFTGEMSIEISFEADGGTGLVAAGTSLWEAAKRLGVDLPADCRGRGECEACAVLIVRGLEVVSPPRESEYKILGGARVAAGERLACQTALIRQGEVVARVVRGAAGSPQPTHTANTQKQELENLIEVEAIRVFEAVNYLRGKSNALIEKFLNLKANEAPLSSRSEKGTTPQGS